MSSVNPAVKDVLKRGALVAAANWPVALVQWAADSLFKLLIAAPLVGGTVLVVVVIGADPSPLLVLGWRELAATLVTSLLSYPVLLAAFLASLSVVVAGGSLCVFLVKGGTVGVLVAAERAAGAIESRPLRLDAVQAASAFTLDRFVAAAGHLFPRYARLGAALLVAYLGSGGFYLALLLGSRSLVDTWIAPALLTLAFAGWITIVNFLYLLTQVVIAADDCGVGTGARRVLAFLRRERWAVAAVFLVVLAVVVLATGASILAMAALGLIAFVPFLGLTVLPLQLLAWLFRGLVFQFIGLAPVGAYVSLYRRFCRTSAAPEPTPVPARVHAGAALCRPPQAS